MLLMPSVHKVKSCYNPLRLGKIANLALWFVPEGTQSAWILQETYHNSTNYARDEARTSQRLLDPQYSNKIRRRSADAQHRLLFPARILHE